VNLTCCARTEREKAHTDTVLRTVMCWWGAQDGGQPRLRCALADRLVVAVKCL
jgi:hypothetical protein